MKKILSMSEIVAIDLLRFSCLLLLLFFLPPSKSLAVQLQRNLEKTAREQVERDLEELGRMQFVGVSKIHRLIFGGEDASKIVEFYRTRVKYIAWSDIGTNAISNVSASFKDGIMYVGSRFLDPNLSSLSRISALIHEARHADFSAHDWCANPFNFKISGESFRIPKMDNLNLAACDTSGVGSYGVQYIFLRSIVDACENCSQEQKTEARFNSVFDGLIRISDSSEAANLMRYSNRDPEKAFEEMKALISNSLNTPVPDSEYKNYCLTTKKCFQY